jgi:hypothetical protein
MDERRKLPRWQIEVPVCLRCQGQETPIEGRLRDLSFKGFFFSSSQKLEKDTLVKLQIEFKPGFSFYTEAWVCWHKAIGPTHCHGMYFSRIDDQAKEGLFRFVQQNFSDELKRRWYGIEGVRSVERIDGHTVKGGAQMEDKRIFERFSARLPLRFLDLNATQEGTAQTLDISAKGVGFTTNLELNLGTRLELWLGVADKGEPIYARGQVAWSTLLGPAQYKVGVNLERANLLGLSRVLRTL